MFIPIRANMGTTISFPMAQMAIPVETERIRMWQAGSERAVRNVRLGWDNIPNLDGSEE